MKRHCKGKLFGFGAEAVDTGKDTAGGKRDVSRSDIEESRVVENTQGA